MPEQLISSLIYHDVVSADRPLSSSGFAGAIADRYKLREDTFADHLARIADRVADPRSLRLTFDDGGRSAVSTTAPLLERHGLRGLFFIVTDRIGEPEFVTADDIKALADAGHEIGTHTATHPANLAGLSRQEIENEWQRSRRRLEELIGREVRVASVPGGNSSPAVEQAAADAGLRELFTSRPTRSSWTRSGMTVRGRFSIVSATPAEKAAAFAAGDRLTVGRERAVFEAKRIGKRLLGPAYVQLSAGYWKRRAAADSPAVR